jgi:transcriptional regulator with XRE-family HTH domain
MVKSLHTRRYDCLRTLMIAAREHAALTQTEVARRLGRPQSFVSKYETGERRLDVIDYLQICSALEVDPFTILAELLSTP